MLITWILDEVFSGNVLVCVAVALCVIVALWQAIFDENELGGVIWLGVFLLVGTVIAAMTILLSVLIGLAWASEWKTIVGGYLFLPMLSGFICILVRIYSLICSMLNANRHG